MPILGHSAARAITVAGCSAFVASEMIGVARDRERIPAVAGQCVGPLLHAAMVALELSGMVNQEASAAVHDVLADYLNSYGGANGPIVDVTARPAPSAPPPGTMVS